MVVRRRKKIQAMRGRKRTYGWGSSKKHRGKGSRGGVGRAGMSGKKGQQRVHTSFNVKEYRRGGRRGFRRKYAEHLEKGSSINIRDIEQRLPAWVIAGFAVKKPEGVEIDLEKAGYQKVLGGGAPRQKLIIKAGGFSASAKKKIEAAGGKAETAV